MSCFEGCAWRPDDLEQLSAAGIGVDEAERQLALLRGPRRCVVLDRPAVLGDGLQRLEPWEQKAWQRLHADAARAGRWSKFVPASGAATRMFAWANEQDPTRLCNRLADFAFFDALQRACAEVGHDVGERIRPEAIEPIISRLLTHPGLNYGSLPKGLLLFHRDADGARTAFAEHLWEAARNFRCADGLVRAHFTVSPEHQALFEQHLETLRQPLRSRCDSQLEIRFSVQHPATDTLAIDSLGQPWRDSAGKLILRPGGHGALITNLAQPDADLVFVKNIDNVLHPRHQEPTHLWIQALGGRLIELQTQQQAWLFALERQAGGQTGLLLEKTNRGLPAIASQSASLAETLAAAERWLNEQFGAERLGTAVQSGVGLTERLKQIRERLDRPIRVCGMVRNAGEPGGGPFWVREPDGSRSLQIVESAEIDLQDPQQRQIFHAATHFNPVFLALGLRNHRGQLYDVLRYVNPNRVILTQKAMQGQMVRVLERPGLWNGAMDHWNTVFVEVPETVFAPVKTVFDLLRDEHQPVR
jgi:hypothetical protein